MSEEASPRPAEARVSANRRPIIPVALVALLTVALAGLAYAESNEWLSPANAFISKASTIAATVLLLFAWFVFLSPASPTLRKRVGVVGLVALGLLVAAVKIESVSGDIVPRLRFRWLPHPDQMLGKLETSGASGAVDLSQTSPDDYPQFLGRDRRATLEDVGLARDWSAAPPKLLWKQPIGAAWSSFAVVGPFAVTQEQRGEEELITCYEVDTGKARWQHATSVRFDEKLAGIGPRATPTIHDGKVYAMGALGHVTCLDGATGRQIWQRDIVTEFDAVPPIWGKSCSPLVHENLVIVSAGGIQGKSLVALDKLGGKVVWSGGDDPSSYSSPVLMTLCETPQIVMINAVSVVGHDPHDGRVLWRRGWPEESLVAQEASPSVAQPIAVGDDRILLTKGYGAGSALWKVRREGDKWAVDEVWRNLNMKTKFTNAVVREGYAYGLDEGTLECIKIDGGRKAWKRGRYGHGQVLLVDDLLLVQSEAGDIVLVEANPQVFRELARYKAIDGTAWNPPALVGRKLLVRSNLEAACYELPAASP
jgi:outer membrane protein assembly factor BamB